MEAVMDSALHRTCVSNPHRQGNPLCFVSNGFLEMTGYELPEELVGQNCRVLQGGNTEQEGVKKLREQMGVRPAPRRRPVQTTLPAVALRTTVSPSRDCP